MNLLTRSSINYIFFSIVAFVIGGMSFFAVSGNQIEQPIRLGLALPS